MEKLCSGLNWKNNVYSSGDGETREVDEETTDVLWAETDRDKSCDCVSSSPAKLTIACNAFCNSSNFRAFRFCFSRSRSTFLYSETAFSRVPRDRLRGRLRFAPGRDPLTVEIAEFWLSFAVLKSRFRLRLIGVDISSRVLFCCCVAFSLVVHSSSKSFSPIESVFKKRSK